MNLSTKKHTRRRRYPVNLVKLSYSYEPAEIVKLFGIHRNTVRHWLKEGLVSIDDRRPILVSGAELRAFITGRQQARKQKCGPGEFFCFRCRATRKPWGGMADFSILNNKISKVIAFCSVWKRRCTGRSAARTSRNLSRTSAPRNWHRHD
jgi:hypothetical protein